MKYFLVCICILIMSGCSTDEEKHPNSYVQVIYLNGSSSVGKSVLAKALQDRLEEPYLHTGIDVVIAMMPQKLNHWWGDSAEQGFSWKKISNDDEPDLYELQLGPYAKKVKALNRELVLTILKQGHNVIIDDIALGQDDVDQWRVELKGYRVLYIGVHAPLEVIEERERRRGDRLPGTARWLHGIVHKGSTYDLELDTHQHSVDENVQKIIESL